MRARFTQSRAVAAALLAFLLCAFGAVWPGSAAKLPGEWIEARSAHFVVLGNVPEKKAREVAREFERMRTFFASRIPSAAPTAGPPLRIYVARDDATMKILMPSLVKELGRGVGGRFVDAPTGQFIQLRSGFGAEWDLQIVFHEYFHFLASRLDLDLPLWLEEGLADFWGATQFTNDAIVVGRLVPSRMKERGGPSLERLLVLDRASSEFRDPLRIGTVYAESWALVHYLVLGDKAARSDQLSRYIQLVGAGRESLAAAREAFGDLEKLDREFKRYRAGMLFPLGKMAPAAPGAPLEIAVRKVGDGEAAARIVVAQFSTEATAEMSTWTTLAEREAPAAATTELAVALFALREQRLTDAEVAFTRAAGATAADADDAQMAIPWYGLAAIELHRDSSPAGLARAESRLLRAVELDPGFAAAHSRIAEVYLRQGADPNRALVAIRFARRLRPDDDFLAVREIQILDRLGRRAEVEARTAKIATEALASQSPLYLNDLCWHATLVGYAQAFLPICEKAAELVPKSSSILDSRGVARGATGDLGGAAADFRLALASADSGMSSEERALRQSWIGIIQQGINPFTEELLKQLLYGPLGGLRWGR